MFRFHHEERRYCGHSLLLAMRNLVLPSNWRSGKDFRTLARSRLEDVHALLVEGLNVPRGLRADGVGITSTAYVQPRSKVKILGYLADAVGEINARRAGREGPARLVLLPYLQPSADGNKRTSRLTASSVLLADGYPPLFYRSIDEQSHKGALIHLYEQGALVNLRDLFLAQLRDAAANYFMPVD